MKKFHVYSIIIGIALLFFLIWKIGPRELWRDLTLLGWGLLPLILLEGLVDLFNTVGWRYCLSSPHRSLPFFQIFCIRLAGTSINYLTPTATLGGEVVKGSLLSLNHQGPQAAAGVIIGKLAHSLAQLIFVVLGSFFVLWKIELPAGVWAAMLAGSTLLGAGILGFLAVQKYGKLGAIVRWLVVHKVGGKALEKAAHHITKVDNEFKIFYKTHSIDLTLSMFWHAVGMVCSIMKCWYFLFIMTNQASFVMAAGIWFLGSWIDLMSFAIPSKIGILEGTQVIIFRLFGLQSALGFTYGIALRLEQIFWAGVGLLIYATLLGKKHERGLSPSKRAEGDTPWHT
jgi:uncharacterized protein (TIRG00374 family)